MAVSLSIGLKQTQRLAMTQSLRQSIEMLQLSSLELAETISHELESNPVLEEVSLSRETEYSSELVHDMNLQLSGDTSRADRIEQRDRDFGNTSDAGFQKSYDEDRKQQAIENAFVERESLADHLISQVRLLKGSEQELSFLETLVSLLDSNGFFTEDHESFCAEQSVTPEYLDLSLRKISRLEPIGCGSSSVQQSLLWQCENKFPADELLYEMIRDHFDLLSKLFFDQISKKMDVPLDTIIKKSNLLQNFSPYPGRMYSRNETNYVIPELEVHYIDDQIVLMFYDDLIPGIKINKYYTGLVESSKVDKEIKKYLRECITSAKYLLRSISGRRETIEKVVRAIMECQTGFLKKGPGHLKPLIHANIAEITGFNESTISRVTSNKYVQTVWGIFELKYFFVTRINSDDNEQSSDNVQKLIQDIVANEDPLNPFTDEQIVTRLDNAGIQTARRTVAKYRGILNIPSSTKRKRINKLKME
ncbi:MAG: RNA polymerase factor sigma-54 [Spirochaetes bacterium]|nr:RNA polymerase factor sigma-54 [Spirochaetota bacterium]MBN2771135.1 RNA polymerase factor sigma-54 [Spirochaetota bacterium]